MPNLSVVILCGRSPRHLYFANQLCRHADVKAVVQELPHQWSVSKIQALLRRPRRLWQKAWRWLRDRRRYRGNQEAIFFFGDRPAKLDRPDLQVDVPQINDPEVIAIVKRHNPDLIAVFGTSLIKGPLLEKGRLGIINLHGGLSPEYRGADCTFWALYNSEPEKVGCTIHYINAGIDTGDLIAHVCPEVREGDDELTLFWRAVKDSTGVYVELLDRLAKGEQFGKKQDDKGRLYQVKDRQLRHEIIVNQKLQKGLLKDSSLPKRITWFTISN